MTVPLHQSQFAYGCLRAVINAPTKERDLGLLLRADMDQYPDDCQDRYVADRLTTGKLVDRMQTE
jgi:hypothetical protein